jgi:hypothetical protein
MATLTFDLVNTTTNEIIESFETLPKTIEYIHNHIPYADQFNHTVEAIGENPSEVIECAMASYLAEKYPIADKAPKTIVDESYSEYDIAAEVSVKMKPKVKGYEDDEF